jgi:hypothetical protein
MAPMAAGDTEGRGTEGSPEATAKLLGLTGGAPSERIAFGRWWRRAPKIMQVFDPEQTATRALAGTGTRLAHSRRVASQVQLALPLVDSDWRAAVSAAAWVHDIGYSPAAAVIGFHPLDGARWLRVEGWPDQVTGLVAWHTHAEKEADLRGISPYEDEFARPPDAALAVLTWADLTSAPDGVECEAEERLQQILDRYPPGSVVHEVTRSSWGLLMADFAAVRAGLEAERG